MTLFSCRDAKYKYTEWKVTGGTKESIRYSSLSAIDTTNVGNLVKVWEYRTGDADSINHSQIQCNPIVVDGIMYGTSPQLKLFAISAKTGEELWNFNPVASSALSENKAQNFIPFLSLYDLLN